MFGIVTCHFCGEEDPEDGHYEECRPDLFPHEIGGKCTRPGERCYWDHENDSGILEHMKEI